MSRSVRETKINLMCSIRKTLSNTLAHWLVNRLCNCICDHGSGQIHIFCMEDNSLCNMNYGSKSCMTTAAKRGMQDTVEYGNWTNRDS